MDTFDLELLSVINQCWDEDALLQQSWNEDVYSEQSWNEEALPQQSWNEDVYSEQSWTEDIMLPQGPSLDIQNLDPTPDIHQLFVFYDRKYFGGLLQTCGSVKWSNQMKTSAGLTKMAIAPTSSQFEIKLSGPILTLRPRNDLISTLLHEMIHAFQGMTGQLEKECEGHGSVFKSYAQRIGMEEGVTITIYHNFHDEVTYHRTRSMSYRVK